MTEIIEITLSGKICTAYRLFGMLHREDGPAIEYFNGDKYWYQNNERHREDGPAVELANGKKEWFLNGKQYTEEEFNKIMLEGQHSPLNQDNTMPGIAHNPRGK